MNPILLVVAGACSVAAVVWGRSALRLRIVWRRVEGEHGPEADAAILARSSFRRDLHASAVYGAVGVAAAIAAVLGETATALFGLVLIPVAVSVLYSREFVHEARLAEDRASIERRAEEVLTQEELAPKRWAARLAPEDLPDFAGFDLGRVYQAGTGMRGLQPAELGELREPERQHHVRQLHGVHDGERRAPDPVGCSIPVLSARNRIILRSAPPTGARSVSVGIGTARHRSR